MAFPRYFPETILSSIPETNQLSDYPLEKVYSISLKELKQFSKMADASNVEVPELSISTPSTARKFLKSLARLIQNRRILGQK